MSSIFRRLPWLSSPRVVEDQTRGEEYIELLKSELEVPPLDNSPSSLVLLGRSGAGKSHLLNAAFSSVLLDQGLPLSTVGISGRITRRIIPYNLAPAIDLTVYDTPGYELSGVAHALEVYEERMQVLLSSLAEKGEVVVWYLIRSGTNVESFDVDLLSMVREVGGSSIVTLTQFFKSNAEYQALSRLEDGGLPCKAILPILASDAIIGPTENRVWFERHGLAELLFLTGNTYKSVTTRQAFISLACSMMQEP